MTMSYTIYIERLNEDIEPSEDIISLQELKDALGNIQKCFPVRFSESEVNKLECQDGTVIETQGSKYDIEVFFEESEEWIRMFRWDNGSLSFEGRGFRNSSDNIVACIAFALAESLGAQVKTEDGDVISGLEQE